MENQSEQQIEQEKEEQQEQTVDDSLIIPWINPRMTKVKKKLNHAIKTLLIVWFPVSPFSKNPIEHNFEMKCLYYFWRPSNPSNRDCDLVITWNNPSLFYRFSIDFFWGSEIIDYKYPNT